MTAKPRFSRLYDLLSGAAALCLLSAVGARPAGAPDDPAAPRVLIVSPTGGGLAAEFAELLEEHAIPVTVALWEEAGAERAREFDLVLVTGPGRNVDKARIVTDYDVPVLGVGPYGCKYFGTLGLKHGHPYT